MAQATDPQAMVLALSVEPASARESEELGPSDLLVLACPLEASAESDPLVLACPLEASAESDPLVESVSVQLVPVLVLAPVLDMEVLALDTAVLGTVGLPVELLLVTPDSSRAPASRLLPGATRLDRVASPTTRARQATTSTATAAHTVTQRTSV
uniref:Uncharacterized protein n=1 Tax=Ixodes scapularis TaxID=6945 RepID=A0A4D5RB81_IXOSC